MHEHDPTRLTLLVVFCHVSLIQITCFAHPDLMAGGLVDYCAGQQFSLPWGYP